MSIPDARQVVMLLQVCPGTADLVAGPAMTRDQMEKAMQVGRDAVVELQEGGAMAVCLGELGIGNTTAAAALLAAVRTPRALAAVECSALNGTDT